MAMVTTRSSSTAGSAVLEIDTYATHHRCTGHGIAQVDLVALRQQVLTTCPECQVTSQCVADRQVQQTEVLLLLGIADGSIESTMYCRPAFTVSLSQR